MTKMIMLRNPNDDMQDKFNKFWTNFSAWMDQTLDKNVHLII